MKKATKYLTLFIMVLAVVTGVTTMDVSATETSSATIASETVRIGTMGTNGKVQWSYNESTKTLTLTGEDSGLGQTQTSKDYGLIYEISSDVEKIILEDFKPIGSADKLFAGLSKLKTIEMKNFNTSNITSMNSMFRGCSSLTGLDVSGFDTSNVTSMSYMFDCCYSLTNLDVSGFDTSNVTNMSYMFDCCYSLTNLDVSGFDTGNVVDMNFMFSRCEGLTNLNVSGFETAKVKNMKYMFDGCSGLTNLDVSDFDTSNVTSMEGMFQACTGLRSLDVSSFDTGNVVYMKSMFGGCSSLTGLDVRGFDTENVKNMQYMFSNCSGLISLDLTGFDTKNVKKMNGMFMNGTSLTSLNISGFDTSNVTDMSSMFLNCESLENLDVSGFNTSKVTDMWAMFSGLDKLVSLDVSNFDTSNVTDMESMFYNSSSLRYLDVSNFDTSNVKDMNYMFCHDSSLRYLDMSSFDTSKVTAMKSMLSYCRALEEIHTPGTMATGQVIDLPLTLKDTDGNAVKQITSALCNKTLYKYLLEIGAATTEMGVGESLQLRVMLDKEEQPIADNTKYKWATSSKNVVTVSEAGVIKAVSAGTTTITVSVKDGGVITGVITITVKDKVTLNKNEIKHWTIDQTGTLIAYVNGKQVSGESMTWISSKPEVATCVNGYLVGKSVGTTTISCTRKNGTVATCKVTVVEKLAITSQPVSKSVTEGDSAVFQVTAKGGGLSYQWQFKAPGASTWTNSGLTGAKTASLTVGGELRRNGQQYRCIITDGGGNKITSDAATLMVFEKAVITSQPTNQSVFVGERAVFKVTAEGYNLSYQWQCKFSTASMWNNVTATGATASSLTVPGDVRMSGTKYRCVITDGNGNQVSSNIVTLKVLEKAVLIMQPKDQSVLEGNSAVFKVTATGSNLRYQWQFKAVGTEEWKDSGMTGARTASLTVVGEARRNGQQYRCVITGADGNKITSEAATLKVKVVFGIKSQPTSQSVVEGNSAVFKVVATGYNLSYQWQYKNVGANKWINSGMKGAKTDSITVQGTAARNGQQYRCIITDGNGNRLTSNAVTLTVESILAITGQPANQSVAEGANAVFTVTARGSNLSYQWQYKNAGADKWFNSGMSGAKTSSITVQGTAARNGQQYRCIINDGNGNQIISNAVTLTVK